MSAYLAAAPRRFRALLRLALTVLERSAGARRFSRLALARRVALLERMERSRLAVRRDVLVLLKSLAAVAYARDARVREAVGVVAHCETAGPEPEPARLDPQELLCPEGIETCDVAVIGSGAGGAAAARLLAERGLSVVVVEEGEYHDRSTYSSDPFEALPRLYRDGGFTFCEGRPPVLLPYGRCVGGTTVINSGTCLRAPADVLLRWREEAGIPWATDLDAELESLERDLAVRTIDPARAGRNAELCRLGAEAIGAANGPLPRNAGDVVCCGACPTGCPLDAKRAMHVSELPRASAAGARIRAGARAERILVEAGRACGVRCRRLSDGGAYELRSRAVVLAAGAIGTPALLLRQGLANSSGAVGRHLRVHPACWVGAAFDEPVRGWEGIMQAWEVREWHERGLFLESTFTPFALGSHWLPGAGAELQRRMLRYDRLAVIGVHCAERSSEGRVTVAGGRPRLRYHLTDEDAATIRFGIARAADVHFAAGAREVYPHVGGLATIEAGGQNAIEHGRFPPSALRLEAFHPLGSARMGVDRRRAVVGPSGECHDVPGLYVADASLFPTPLRANPMLTIMACARRIAAGLADRLV